MDRITAPEQFEDKGTRTPAAAPAVRADADVAGAATAAQQALSSGPTGGLAGFGPDVAARVAPPSNQRFRRGIARNPHRLTWLAVNRGMSPPSSLRGQRARPFPFVAGCLCAPRCPGRPGTPV